MAIDRAHKRASATVADITKRRYLAPPGGDPREALLVLVNGGTDLTFTYDAADGSQVRPPGMRWERCRRLPRWIRRSGPVPDG